MSAGLRLQFIMFHVEHYKLEFLLGPLLGNSHY